MRKKLRACRGMSLTETLTALLITSLVAAALAVGVSSALRVYRESTRLAQAQLLSASLSQAVMDQLRYSRDVEGETNPVFTSGSFGPDCAFAEDEEGRLTLGGAPLIGSGAYGDDLLRAQLLLTWDPEEKLFHGELTIRDEGGGPLCASGFDVRSLNGE